MREPGLKPYEWMVKHTPQEEWIRGKGMLIWLGFFFTELGASVYLVSLFMNFRSGWLVGWLLSLVLGGLMHVGYLGKPLRVWRMFSRPIASEVSRGIWVTLFFAVVGFFQVLPVVISGLPWTGEGLALKIIMGILCIVLISHGFTVMRMVRAIPFWNSSSMIPLSVVSGLWVGSQFVLLMMFSAGLDINGVEIWFRWSFLIYVALLAMHLWQATHSSETSSISARKLLWGDCSVYFYVGVIVIGIIVPLIITLIAWVNGVEKMGGATLLLRFICVIIGDLMMRYNIMRSGLYTPLIP